MSEFSIVLSIFSPPDIGALSLNPSLPSPPSPFGSRTMLWSISASGVGSLVNVLFLSVLS